MRNPKDFFRPLAVGAPAPVREIPVRPSRMIHFFPASNPKMVAKVPDMAAKVDVLLANLEDGVPGRRQGGGPGRAGRGGPRRWTSATTQFWTRVNSLDSPWGLDDLTAAVLEAGRALDVIMIPKVEGPEDIHYVDRLLAQLEAKAGLDEPILVHALLETARGVANVEEICAASPRMQGLSLGPADLAANRRMKTTRVGGGHPGYLVRQDPDPDDHRCTPDHLPAGPVALHHRPHGRRLRGQRDPSPSTGPSATSPTRWPARTSSATPTCWAASGPGACTPARSTSPAGCSAPTSAEVAHARPSSPPWATAPAPSCWTARWRTTPASSSAR